MKRFLLFTGAEYYPAGGMNDLDGDFKTYEEAEAKVKKDIENGGNIDWGHVFDTKKSERWTLSKVISETKSRVYEKWQAEQAKKDAEEKRKDAEYERQSKEDEIAWNNRYNFN